MKSIELFAGAGGMALGLEMAGFKTIGLVENNKFASQTLKKNKPNWNVINENIEKISELDLEKYFALKKGELDLLSGGAPCQSFSYAGKKLGLEDTRGTLFYHYARFLKKLQPKMFLFENEVYFIYKKILNANNFGVAQKRERLFIVGIRKDLFKKGYKFNFPKKHKYKPVLKDILLNCPLSQGASYSEKKKKIFELVPPGGNWKNIPVSIAKEYMKGTWDSKGGHTTTLRRMSFDEPMFTVMTSPSQKLTERCHPVETRPFTIRENARCQSFPDEWLFIGSIAEQYKQIGNAVPVLLAYEIGKEIKKTLKKQN